MATKRKPKRPAKRARRPASRTTSRRPKRHRPETARARMLSASLTVDALTRSVAWYERVLGFTVTDRWESDGTLHGVELAAGDTRVTLNQDDWAKGRDRVKGLGVRFYFSTVQNIDQLAADITARGGVLDYPPRTMPWGSRLFAITDPDGFKISFVQQKP
ncbi:MAG: VOC family protein [Gemmatimonadales bacterium]